jgi:LysM repeat protein
VSYIKSSKEIFKMARSSWNKGTRVLLDAGDATPIPEQTPVKTEPLTKENMQPVSQVSNDIPSIVRAVLKEIYGEQGASAVGQGQGGFQDPDEPVSSTGTMLDAAPIPEGSYIIKKGDTASQIAADNPFTLTQLKESNPHIEDFDKIEVGQYLNFPPVGKAKAGQLPASMEVVAEQPTEEIKKDNDAQIGAGVGTTTDNTDAAVDTFSTLIIDGVSETILKQENITDMFGGLKDVEGETSHVDGRGYFTMAYGVVPDKNSVTKSDGTSFDPKGNHGFTTATAGTVDVSKATHTLKYKNSKGKVVSFKVKRTDYSSDEEFAKAVVGLYNREAKKMYGSGWDSLPESSKALGLDLAWNVGLGSIGWPSVKLAMKEASKKNPSTTNLFKFTANIRSGTQYPRGLFKRRLIQYNKVANQVDKAATYSTEAINNAQGTRIGTKYIANRADGTEIGSWSYVDKVDDPKTTKNEKRTPSAEILQANVSLS